MENNKEKELMEEVLEEEVTLGVEKEEAQEEDRCEDLDKILEIEDDKEFEEASIELENKCEHCKNRICETNGQIDELLDKMDLSEEDILSILAEAEEGDKKDPRKEEENPEVLAKRAKKVKVPKDLKESELIGKARERAVATALSIKIFLEEGIDYESAVGLGNNIIQGIVQEELAKLQIINQRKNGEI